MRCYYCLEEGHFGNKCIIFNSNVSITISETLLNKILWQVCQEKNCSRKMKRLIDLAQCNNIKFDLTVSNNMLFRCACYNNDIETAEYLLKMEPKINVRSLNDSAFINASWEYKFTGSFKDIILLLIREEPYVYSYSFDTKQKKINTFEEEKEARWNTKRGAILTSSYLKENDTILNRLPSELSRTVIEFLYKK
jgi:hypothetical protein